MDAVYSTHQKVKKSQISIKMVKMKTPLGRSSQRWKENIKWMFKRKGERMQTGLMRLRMVLVASAFEHNNEYLGLLE
jgi:hypothetical protein